MLEGKKILLVITGGIAAYKSLELIRLLQVNKASVVPVMTKSSQQFVTPLSVSAIAGSKVYTELFDLTAEAEMGHIELSRSADIILVAPASADFLSKMAQGTCDDLASTLLLATDKPVLVAPSMNVRMWHHPATQRNLGAIRDDGIVTIGPNQGDMACGEFGFGRMSEPAEVITLRFSRWLWHDASCDVQEYADDKTGSKASHHACKCTCKHPYEKESNGNVECNVKLCYSLYTKL